MTPLTITTGVGVRAIDKILDGDIRSATRASLAKQLSQPLPDVKAPENVPEESADPEAANDIAGPQAKGKKNKNSLLLPASGDPEIFKVVSLVLGSPEFQRQ